MLGASAVCWCARLATNSAHGEHDSPCAEFVLSLAVPICARQVRESPEQAAERLGGEYVSSDHRAGGAGTRGWPYYRKNDSGGSATFVYGVCCSAGMVSRAGGAAHERAGHADRPPRQHRRRRTSRAAVHDAQCCSACCRMLAAACTQCWRAVVVGSRVSRGMSRDVLRGTWFRVVFARPWSDWDHS